MLTIKLDQIHEKKRLLFRITLCVRNFREVLFHYVIGLLRAVDLVFVY